MKKSIFTVIILAIAMISCQSNNKKKSENNNEATEHHFGAVESHDPEVIDVKSEDISKSIQTTSIDNVVNEYLNLKNALTKDSSNEAAIAGKKIVVEISKIDISSLTKEQKQVFDDVMDDAKENAEHIGDNANKIDHQREHFALLSKDVNDIVSVFKTSKKLYQNFCPMYDNGKGVIWVSETEEIKNPYYGNKMLSCGSVKKEL
tara:strand:- start:5221 stop:5832 length:612 start_codon:yes stop_codon:yes gene_type:complete